MFFKIAALKNFAITVKKTAVLECLFNKFANPQVFSYEIFKNSFFCRHVTVHYTFSKFYVMIASFWRPWVQNWHFPFSCAIALISSMVVFTPKYLVSVSSHALQPRLQHYSDWIAIIYCENCEYKFFWILHYVIISL